jgi:hypothetical protein
VVLLIPALAIWFLLLFVRTVRDNRWQMPVVPRWLLAGALLSAALFAMLRNLPIPYGRWLAP